MGKILPKENRITFLNIRKEAKPGAKAAFWRISNWSSSYAYTETMHRDFNINSDITKKLGKQD